MGAISVPGGDRSDVGRSEEHTSELQSRFELVCRFLLEKKKPAVPASLPLTLAPPTGCIPKQLLWSQPYRILCIASLDGNRILRATLASDGRPTTPVPHR